MITMTNPKDRIQFVLDQLNMTPTALARSLRMSSPQPLFHILNEKYGISPHMANRIASVYPFSRRWLRSGQGEPLLPGADMNTSVADRVKELMEYLVVSEKSFALILSVPTKVIEDITLKNVNPSPELLRHIALTLPIVNIEWVQTGKGEMIKKNERALAY